MKPWFVKEADIIKFPEPKAKVIELPNVQSYPDFLTGVKDLHNRKAKGEISQDSHDKLYSDLINRFMKKESFETPWFLREETLQEQSLRDKLQILFNLIKSGGLEFLKTLWNNFTGWLKKNKTTTPAQQNNNQPVQEAIPFVGDVKKIEKQILDNPGYLESPDLNQLLEKVKETRKQAIAGLQNFVVIIQKELINLFEAIWHKVSPQEFNATVSWLGGGPLDMSIIEESKNRPIDILEAAKKTNKKAYQILELNSTIQNIASLKIGRQGKGELLLQTLFGGAGAGGKPGAKGDVKIGTNEYEVKAQDPKSNVSQTNPFVFFSDDKEDVKDKTISIATKNMIAKLQSFGAKGFTTAKGGFVSDRSQKDLVRQAGGSWNNFGGKGLISFINSLTKANAKEILESFINDAFGINDKTINEYIDQSLPGNDKALDFQPMVLKKAFVLANFLHYQKAKQFTGIIMIDVLSRINGGKLVIRTIDKNNILDLIKTDKVWAKRPESFNELLLGKAQGGLPGINFQI